MSGTFGVLETGFLLGRLAHLGFLRHFHPVRVLVSEHLHLGTVSTEELVH